MCFFREAARGRLLTPSECRNAPSVTFDRLASGTGLDAAALRDVAPSIRLPAIEATGAIDAETLRALIADGLMALLSPPATQTAATEAD